jgi:hypothetical protein
MTRIALLAALLGLPVQIALADFIECSDQKFDAGWTKVELLGRAYCASPKICGGPNNYSKHTDYEQCVRKKLQEQFPIIECSNKKPDDTWVRVSLSGKTYCLSRKVCGGPDRFTSWTDYSNCITPKIEQYSAKIIKVFTPTLRECSTSREREDEIYAKCLAEKLSPRSDRDHKRAIRVACGYTACNPSIIDRFKY